MNESPIEKVECPSCGQRYSVQITDQEQDVTCQACQAVFTVAHIDEPESPPSRPIATASALNRTPSLPSKKPKSSVTLLDRFMGLLFRFGKTFAGFFALLCLLFIILSLGIFTWNLRTNFKVPPYSDVATSKTDDNSSTDTADLDEKRMIEKKYGDQVSKIIKEHKFDQNYYYSILSMVQSREKDNRSHFLGGLENALKSHEEATTKDPKDSTSVVEISERYAYVFSREERRYKSEKQKAKTIRWYALGATSLSCFLLFMMLIIPALLKIEENTRKTA